MLKILAIDTSTDSCSVALTTAKQIDERFIIAPKEHTKVILAMIESILLDNQINLEQLHAIAFGHGPGSFTGVRLAASIVQSFAFALDLPVIKLSTLRAMAQEILVKYQFNKVLVAQDARMKEVYLGQYQVNRNGIMQAIKPDQLVKPEVMGTISQAYEVGVGSGFTVYKSEVKNNLKKIPKSHIHAKYLAQLAIDDFNHNRLVSPNEALPIYLRNKVV